MRFLDQLVRLAPAERVRELEVRPGRRVGRRGIRFSAGASEGRRKLVGGTLPGRGHQHLRQVVVKLRLIVNDEDPRVPARPRRRLDAR